MSGPFVKMGGHFRFGQTAAGQLWTANGASLKTLDDPSYLDQAPAGVPTVFRKYMGDGDQQYCQNSPAVFLQAVQDALQGRHPTWIEGPNECGYDDVVDFTSWMTDYTALAHQAGFQVAGFSYGVGHPAQSALLYIAQHNFAGVDALAIHEYWQTGAPFDALGLYHQTLNQWLAQAGYGSHPPWVISECGRIQGWQAAGLGAAQAAQELIAYDQIVANDPTIAAVQTFTHGGCPDFCPFEIDPLAPSLWPASTGCTSDADCQQFGAGYTCLNGVCVPPSTGCTSDAQCQQQYGPGYACRNGRCVRLPPAPPGPSPALLLAGLLAGGVVGGAIYFISQESGG